MKVSILSSMFIVLFILVVPVLIWASETSVTQTWPPTVPATDWQADWITLDNLPPGRGDREGATLSNLWICFRKEFSLEKIPEQISTRIACDSKYWLYVNGKLVVFEGQLKRGPTPKDTYFDVVDLAPHLKSGKNVIAVLMWFFGKEGFSHKNSGVPGFLFDLQADGFELLSDASWKAYLYTKLPDNNSAWKDNKYTAFERITADPQPNFRLPESNIRYDARFEFQGDWTAPDFDDSDWLAPKTVGKPPVAPWNELYERPIPLWKDFGVKDYVNQDDIPKESDGKPIVCRLPYNAQVTPTLKVEAPEGFCIDIRTDNYYGGSQYNVRTEYVTKNGIQEFETPGWMNGHQVIYTMPPGIKIHSLQYRETGYDTEFAGSFECDDPFFNKLWEKSARTLYITMRDTYMDCPDRERAQWWGDAVNELGEAFYALDPKSALLARKSMYELMRWQKDDGVIFSPVPAGNWDRELPMQMLASIGPCGFGLWCHTTGDYEPLRDLYPRMKKYLDLFEFADDGLVKHRTGAWDWGDWGDNIDLRVLTNCWYYMAMQTQIQTATDLASRGSTLGGSGTHFLENISEPEAIRKRIRENFDKVFWTGKEYRDPDYKGKTDDRANAMAVISSLASVDKFPAIREVLLREKHASPYMEKYVLEALFEMDNAEDAFVRMKERFKKMVEHEHTTLWEGWGIGKEGYGGGTINHAWSGGGLTMLARYATGIHFAGHHYFLIGPQMGPLKWIKSKTPTQYGILCVDLERTKNGIKAKMTIPKEIRVQFLWGGYGKKAKLIHADNTVQDLNLPYPELQPILTEGTWTIETIEKENIAQSIP